MKLRETLHLLRKKSVDPDAVTFEIVSKCFCEKDVMQFVIGNVCQVKVQRKHFVGGKNLHQIETHLFTTAFSEWVSLL